MQRVKLFAQGVRMRVERSIFFRHEIARAGIQLMGVFLVMVLWTYCASYGLYYVFKALFDAWGLTAQNLPLAPRWAQWVFANYRFVVLIANRLGMAVLSMAMIRRIFKRQAKFSMNPAKLLCGAGIGIGVVALSAAVFLALDSMRLEVPLSRPALSSQPLMLLIVYFVAAVSEELLDRALIMRLFRRMFEDIGGGIIVSWIMAAIALAGLSGLTIGVIGFVNVFMMGLICAILHDIGLAPVSIGLRFGWSWATISLIGFSGSMYEPIYSLYGVSEAWLVGDSGLISGFWMTPLLAMGLGAVLLMYARRRKQPNLEQLEQC